MKTYTAVRMYNVEIRVTVQASSPEEAAEAVGGYLECRYEANGDALEIGIEMGPTWALNLGPPG